MMQPKTRKERVAEYGSFLYCPKKDTICSEMDNDEGICGRQLCHLEDPAYLRLQERIRRNVAENAERERLQRLAEKNEKPAPIRRQTKTRTDILEEKIEQKESWARHLYKNNKPRAADSVMRDVMALRKQLKDMKGA